jgi:kumamolisin
VRVLLALLASTALALPATAAAAAGPQLPSGQVDVLISLRHPRGLNQFVRSVSDPRSPSYRDYASVAALAKRFGAPAGDRGKTLAWLSRHDLRGTIGPTGTYLTATLPRRLAARLLPRPAGASASSLDPRERRVPAALRGAVARVDTLSRRPALSRQPSSRRPGTSFAAAAAKQKAFTSIMLESGTPSGCPAGVNAGEGPPLRPFTPRQYLTAYGHTEMHARGFEGQGQTVAVVETDGFRRSDVTTFGRCFGLHTPPTQAVPVGIGKPLKPGEETTLDLEMLSAGAPRLRRILVYEGRETERGVVLTAGAALGSPGHQPDAISISLGICEPEFSGNLALREAFDNIFAVAAGAGISTLVSAGDTGSSGCRVENAEGQTTALPLAAVSLPSSSPYVTAVGGTNLDLSAKNRIKKEVVWNDLPIQPGGGGGGASILSPHRPWWQRHVGHYGAGRTVPDIAALADVYPGYAYFCTAKPCAGLPQLTPGWSSIGGTSAATPLMTAGVLLANQYAAKRGQPPLGFLNPLLYELGADQKARKRAFNDVTEGNNDLGRLLPPEAGGGHPLGCCHAGPGYDWASGWGSLKLPGFAELAAAAG